MNQQIQQAAQFVRNRSTVVHPKVGVILGTGMDRVLPLEGESLGVSLPFGHIPHFTESTSPSHRGELQLGIVEGVEVCIMRGRLHCYEGHSPQKVTFPVRVMKELGCEILIATCAAGSYNPDLPSGVLVIIKDHINLIGSNPLTGPNDETLGPRFPDMSEPYDPRLRSLAKIHALELEAEVREGILTAVLGPCLETAAEYKMLQILGGDIVSMSTVPEVIVARHSGMRVLGIAMVTDQCDPDNLVPTTIEEILQTAAELERDLNTLLTRVISEVRS